MTGDTPESNSGHFFGVVNIFFPFIIFPFQGCQGKGVLENKKGDSCWGLLKNFLGTVSAKLKPVSSQLWPYPFSTDLLCYPLKIGTKKGKRTSIATEALLPVIFSYVIVLAIYPVKARLTPFNRGFSSSLDPPRSLKKGKTYPISNRVIIALFLPSTLSSVLSVARNSLALPLAG